MVRTKKHLLIAAIALFAILLTGFAFIGMNSHTASATATSYVTLYTPGDTTITSSGGFEYYNSSNVNTHYDDTDHVLRIRHTTYGAGYGVANYLQFTLPRQEGFTDFAGYAIWAEFPTSTDNYTATIMINGKASNVGATYGFLDATESGNATTYRYEEAAMPWKRMTGKNGFYGWILIPKEAFTGDVSIASSNMPFRFMIEAEGDFIRTGTFDIDLGRIVAYSDAQAFIKEISAEEGRKYVGNHVNLAMKNGASVRYSTKNGYGGIRFAYSMPKTDYIELFSNVGEGKLYKDITFGMVIAPTIGYTDTHSFNVTSLFGFGTADTQKWYTWAGEDAGGCTEIINLTRKHLASDTADNSLMTFYGAITDINSTNLARQFTGQGYIQFQYNSDDSYAYTMITPYGNDIANNQRSATRVSQALVAASKGTAAQRTWVTTNYITPVVETEATTTYYVKHILINNEGKSRVYTTQSATVAVNQSVSATPLSIGGAIYNASKSTASGKALANNALVLNLYYDLMYTSITFEDSSTVGKSNDDSNYSSYGRYTTQKYTGNYSLGITPHASNGKWQKLFLADSSGNYYNYNLTNITAITFWIYYTGSTTLPDGSDSKLALLLTDNTGAEFKPGGNLVEYKAIENLTPGVWKRYTFTIDKTKGIDLSSVRIAFANVGGTYTHRETFYIDSISFVP